MTESEILIQWVFDEIGSRPKGRIYIQKRSYPLIKDRLDEFIRANSHFGLSTEVRFKDHYYEITWQHPPMVSSSIFTTALGCLIKLTDSPEHLGNGSLMELSIDSRRAEVYLSRQDEERLLTILRARMKSGSEIEFTDNSVAYLGVDGEPHTTWKPETDANA
jgi:hypothetical protein